MCNRKLFLGLAFALLIILIVLMLWRSFPGNQIISESQYEGVIFHNKNAISVLGYMLTNDQAEDAYWIPTEAEIAELERQLHQYVQEQSPTVAAQLTIYKRQYFGFWRGGRQLVFVVGFCEPVEVNWRRELVAMPMTDCYFEAQYDVASDHILYFWARDDQQ